MKKIQPNSFEAVALFVMYICNQDGQISNAEIKEFQDDFPYLKRLYFDVFGEFIYEDFLDDLDDERAASASSWFMTTTTEAAIYTPWEWVPNPP